MSETSQRNGFGLHSKEYYKGVFDNLSNDNNSYLVIAKHEEKILIIDVIIVFGKTANYVFGASSNEFRDTLPSYKAQWEAILHAKKIGCTIYNFGGVSINSQSKKWEGLSAFKKRWGGEILEHSPFYDIITQPFWYFLYKIKKLF